MTTTKDRPASSFNGLGIAPKLLGALDAMKFTVPTPIQQQAIPVACSGKDLVGIAQTGTGKTIAFAIPMLQQIAARQGRGLVLVPTRELAIQVNSVFENFARTVGLRTAVLIGGESIGRQKNALRANPQVLIATPGRLIDHINQRNVRLDGVKILVLDEADRMLDMGFAPQIEKILQTVPKQRQTMLFSATMPDEIMKLASSYMQLPVRVEVARQGTAAEKVAQEIFVVAHTEKPKLLAKLLDKYWGSVLLFSRTKHRARTISRSINQMGHTAAEIHSNRTLSQRKEALDGFKNGKYRVLVATDIAARGIDVTGIELVLNYDLPDEIDNYVHRIGRTGRAGHEGHAISFATPEQGADVRAIERLIRTPLPVSKHPDMPELELLRHPSPQPKQQQRGRPQRDQQRHGQQHGQQQQGRRSHEQGNQPQQHGHHKQYGQPPVAANAPRNQHNAGHNRQQQKQNKPAQPQQQKPQPAPKPQQRNLQQQKPAQNKPPQPQGNLPHQHNAPKPAPRPVQPQGQPHPKPEPGPRHQPPQKPETPHAGAPAQQDASGRLEIRSIGGQRQIIGKLDKSHPWAKKGN